MAIIIEFSSKIETSSRPYGTFRYQERIFYFYNISLKFSSQFSCVMGHGLIGQRAIFYIFLKNNTSTAPEPDSY